MKPENEGTIELRLKSVAVTLEAVALARYVGKITSGAGDTGVSAEYSSVKASRGFWAGWTSVIGLRSPG